MKYKLLFILFFQSFFISRSQNLPSFTVSINDTASKGYYFFVPIRIGPGAINFPPTHMILDKTGQVVYYKKFPGQSSGDFKIQPNGLISYSKQNKFYLMDSTFTVVDSVSTKNNVVFDGHDLQIMPNGHFLILGFENVIMNLSSYNLFNGNNPGGANATVKCGVIQEQDANKNVVFEWHCKDHYAFNDVDPAWLTNPNNVDWTHLNAVEYDTDGNFLLSVRHFNEITKIKRSDSSVMWRLGGNANQFNFTNDVPMFKAQHDIRRISNGNITLFDNGKLSPFHTAAAKEYQLNEVTLTATLSWSYIENNVTYSRALGNHQRIPNGNSLINYGMLNNLNHIFNVVKPAGSKVFEIVFADTLRSYRSFNYLTLPWDLKRPNISCSTNGGQVVLNAGAGHASYLWSNAATTQTIIAANSGTYSVFVPKGQGGFISSAQYIVDITNPCVFTSIKEEIPQQTINIYPNPVLNELTITSNGTPFSKTMIQLSDLLGNIIYTEEISSANDFKLSLSNIVSGVYFLRINDVVKKIIKE